jgi:tubulin polyglutamylase TTLL9
VHLTNVAI